MKVTNPDLRHAIEATRGSRSTILAGSKGMVWRDGATESEGQIRDMTVVGLTFTDNEDGTGILSAGGSVGTGGYPSFPVTTFGAVGDGTTDDTASINDAIAAINANGCGVLYFPCGTYKVTGALTTITAECTILGDGQSNQVGTANISRINCTSQTAVLFNISARMARFEKIAMFNTYAGNASAGSAVKTLAASYRQKVDFEAVTINGFYIGADIQTGEAWVMHNTYVQDCVLYDVKIRNTDVADVGDWKISNSVFGQNDRAATAAIQIESSGGGKIVNCKVNSGTNHHQYGINVVPASATSILLVANCSIENTSSTAIRVTNAAVWPNIIINGNQFGMYQTTDPTISISGQARVVICDNIARYTSTAAAMISLTSVTECYLTHNIGSNATALYTQTGSTIIEDSGGIANGVAITGVPTANQTVYAITATTAAWSSNIWKPLMSGGAVIVDGDGAAVMALGAP